MAINAPIIEVLGVIPNEVINCIPIIAPKAAIRIENRMNGKSNVFFI